MILKDKKYSLKYVKKTLEIFSKQDVDGGLIGGAALNAEDFFAIVNAIS